MDSLISCSPISYTTSLYFNSVSTVSPHQSYILAGSNYAIRAKIESMVLILSKTITLLTSKD